MSNDGNGDRSLRWLKRAVAVPYSWLVLFFLTPFTRLVHIFSAPIWYLGRPGYQVVRRNRNLGQPRNASRAKLANPFQADSREHDAERATRER